MSAALHLAGTQKQIVMLLDARSFERQRLAELSATAIVKCKRVSVRDGTEPLDRPIEEGFHEIGRRKLEALLDAVIEDLDLEIVTLMVIYAVMMMSFVVLGTAVVRERFITLLFFDVHFRLPV